MRVFARIVWADVGRRTCARLLNALLTLSTVAACIAQTASTASGTVKGQVTDSGARGAPIRGAHVVFHYDHAGAIRPVDRPDITRETDAAGDFEAELEPGFYDLCIMATSFRPTCEKVLVTGGSTTRRDVAMTTDPLVASHLDDRFPMGPGTIPPGHVIRGADGRVACLGFSAPGPAGQPALGVWIREPEAPATDALNKLPAQLRDFSKLPVRVTLVSLSGESRRPSTVDQSLQHPTVDGAQSSDNFVFAIFPLDSIVAGVTIVGQRVAVAPNGTRITSETRCGITAADLAFWR